MNHAIGTTDPCAKLEAVIATGQLALRHTRQADPHAETRALLLLVRELAEHPEGFFETLVATARQLSNADSAGISLLNESIGRFVWPAVSGPLDVYVGQGTPADFGPCGTVLDRRAAILFVHPERYFTYLEPITPSLEEVLIIPFYLGDKAVGTVWAVIHEQGRSFDSEDKRMLEGLSAFAASAYRVFLNTGALQPMLSGASVAARGTPASKQEGSQPV